MIKFKKIAFLLLAGIYCLTFSSISLAGFDYKVNVTNKTGQPIKITFINDNNDPVGSTSFTTNETKNLQSSDKSPKDTNFGQGHSKTAVNTLKVYTADGTNICNISLTIYAIIDDSSGFGIKDPTYNGCSVTADNDCVITNNLCGGVNQPAYRPSFTLTTKSLKDRLIIIN